MLTVFITEYECEQHDNTADFILEVVLLNEAQEAKCKEQTN